MGCRPSYPDCISQHRPSGVRAELLAHQDVASDEYRSPPGLGGNGQPAFTGLYRLCNHC
jgi:hypothetical protein